ERAHPELGTGDFGVSSHRALATAAHRREKHALRGDALAGVEMVEALANRGDAFVLLPDFDTDGALADAREHYVSVEDGGKEAVRNGVAFQSALGRDAEIEPAESR